MVKPALRLDRAEFLTRYWPGLYQPGQHVITFGPTQRAGKTHLMFQLLAATRQPQHRTVFCMKPIDPTVSRWTEGLGYRETPVWPPGPRWPWQQRPPGYTLWPRFTMDPDIDEPHVRAVFREAMLDRYKRGRSILFLDEIYGICAELGLSKELLTIVTKGGGGGTGAWMATQKPSGTQQAPLPGFVFNNPTHFFLGPDNEVRNRKRYADLAGGLGTDFIEYHVLSLKRYEFLYINADGESAIIGA